MKSTFIILFLTYFSSFLFGQQESEMEWKKIELTDSIELNKIFSDFIYGIENKDSQKIKKYSLSEIDCDLCIIKDYTIQKKYDDLISINTFINQAYKNFTESPLYRAYEKRGCRFSKMIIPDFNTRNLPNDYGKDLILYEVWIQTYLPNEWAEGHEGQSHSFQFVKIKNEYKFYGISSIP